MTRPAERTQKHKIGVIIKKQLWTLLSLIIITWGIDQIWLHSQTTIVKSLTMGASLNWITQLTFAWFAFRYTGYKARQHIINQLYRGQILKWIITLTGFTLILINLKPLSAPALFIGFIIMQINHSYLLWTLK